MKPQEHLTLYIETMEDKNFIPTKKMNDAWVLSLEKHLLIKHYCFLKVQIIGNNLKCVGDCKPSEHSTSYTYKIKFTPQRHPRVYVTNPIIQYCEDIHMYPQDNSLCLYYPKDFSWKNDSHLYNTIVPWTHEWFVFYELYKIYGKWFHPSVLHNSNNKLIN